MAKQVKGVRANKPNDSFGVTNNDNLYRGKYREDVYKDEQVLEQGSIVEIEHPELGKMRMPKPPVNFEGQEEFPRSLAPILGADTREVLADLGIEDDIISSMEEREEQNRVMLASFTPVSTE